MNTEKNFFKRTNNLWISLIIDIRLVFAIIFAMLYIQEKCTSFSCAMVGYRQPGHMTPLNIIIPLYYVVSMILAIFLVLFLIFCRVRTLQKKKNSTKFLLLHIGEVIFALLTVFILLIPPFITEKTITTKEFVIEQEENAAAVLGLTRETTDECAMEYDYNAQYNSYTGSHVVCVIPKNSGTSYYYDSETDTIYSANAGKTYFEAISSAIKEFCEEEDVKSTISIFGCYATFDIVSHNDPDSDVAAGDPSFVSVFGFPIDKESLDITGKRQETIIETPANATMTDFTIQIVKNDLTENEMDELREYLLKKIDIAMDVMYY